MKYGVCGHALRRDGECRLCWLEEQGPEKIRARILASAPAPSYVVRVSSVVTRDKRAMAAIASGATMIPVADVSAFREGMAIDFIDGSDLIRQERERWRGREDEANAYHLPRPEGLYLVWHRADQLRTEAQLAMDRERGREDRDGFTDACAQTRIHLGDRWRDENPDGPAMEYGAAADLIVGHTSRDVPAWNEPRVAAPLNTPRVHGGANPAVAGRISYGSFDSLTD